MLAAAPVRAEPTMTVSLVDVPAPVTTVEATSRGSFDGTGAYAFTDDGVLLVAPCPDEPDGWCVDETEPTPVEVPSRPEGFSEPLPDGRVARSAAGYAAWYTSPTDEYAHGVLGDAIEARGLAVSVRQGGEDVHAGMTMGTRMSVFEDIAPRLTDLDADGRPELVTIMTSTGLVVGHHGLGATPGASLAVFATTRPVAVGSSFVLAPPSLIARTPPIGTPNRWLNPAAIHDFDGDGVMDVALVETPHIGGDLQLWSGASLLAGEPRLLAARRGFSNHAIGSRALDLAEVVRIGDRDALVLPDATRSALVAVRYEDGEWVEIARAVLPARVLSGIAAVGRDLAVGLDDGTLARVVIAD